MAMERASAELGKIFGAGAKHDDFELMGEGED
jgi:hypothetical protein